MFCAVKQIKRRGKKKKRPAAEIINLQDNAALLSPINSERAKSDILSLRNAVNGEAALEGCSWSFSLDAEEGGQQSGNWSEVTLLLFFFLLSSGHPLSN